jgi:hypothetical protein
LAESVGISAGDRGVAHPYLRVGPALLLGARPHRLSKQGPLCAIGHAGGINEIGGHVPPLDPVVGMRTVICGEGECPAGRDGGESGVGGIESGIALRPRAPVAKPEQQCATHQDAAGYLKFIAHRRKS